MSVSDRMSRLLDEKIQSPSNPKGRAAYAKSLGGWSKAASKVAQSYGDKLADMKPKNDAESALQVQMKKLLQSVSGEMGQLASMVGNLK
jgi:hypothetical protein